MSGSATIRRAGHEVNTGLAPATADLPADLADAGRRIAAWGGNPARFAQLLANAATTGPGLTEEQRVAAASVAGWRAGVLGLRDDALAAAARLAGQLGPQPVASLLTLSPGNVDAFLAAQRTDRFAWPAWAGLGRAYTVARIGGFVGLGGPWQLPPRDVVDVAPGCWLVTTGEETWRIDADLFGHVVSRADGSRPDGRDEQATARLMTQPTSYLATVVAGP